MNILLISSGFQGVYSFFERRIAGALQKAGHHCAAFQAGSMLNVFKLKQQFRQPDLILLMAGLKVQEPVLECIRQSGIKSAVWMTEDPYYMDWTVPAAAYVDYIFTIDEAALEQYKALGHPRVYHLPLGTDPALFCPSPVSAEFESELCLVGVPYSNRIEMIDFLLAATDYRIQLVGRGWSRYVQQWNLSASGRVGLVNAWVKPETAAGYYNGAKIVLNIHRLADERYNRNRMGVAAKSINNRTFDAAACAAFQLTDDKPGLSGQFAAGQEIIPYLDKYDFLQKLHYYMAHDQERRHIADAARRRVLAAHTFEHRIQQLLGIIQV
ncbi:glycosyltransferase [Paenibacillus sp. FSL K6-1096]|uniref:CgeB family protein n=1 Tax=Paenibacillus sp. FSL K6-1096 TaxID=2921460 RepID=UPI0030EF556B